MHTIGQGCPKEDDSAFFAPYHCGTVAGPFVVNGIAKFWNREGFLEKKGFDSRDKVISGFVHEIRKAYEGSRLTRSHCHFSFDSVPYFGCKISWVHLLFSINAIRYNMRFFENTKLDISLMLQLEYWAEESMRSFDAEGAYGLLHYIADGMEQGNPYIYQFMRSINAAHFELGGGKTSFRRLPKLLRRAVYATDEYQKYNAFLALEAQRLNCDVNDLDTGLLAKLFAGIQ